VRVCVCVCVCVCVFVCLCMCGMCVCVCVCVCVCLQVLSFQVLFAQHHAARGTATYFVGCALLLPRDALRMLLSTRYFKLSSTRLYYTTVWSINGHIARQIAGRDGVCGLTP
jgi:hypothetical protein